jgi:hypothetical protein
VKERKKVVITNAFVDLHPQAKLWATTSFIYRQHVDPPFLKSLFAFERIQYSCCW